MMFIVFFLCFTTLIAPFSDQSHGRGEFKYGKTLWDYYGFCSTEQKKAFAFLLKKTGLNIKNPVIKGHLAPLDLWKIMTLVQQTQQQWVRRTHGKERWDVVKKEYPQSMLSHLRILGLVDAHLSTSPASDAICVLGSTGPSMNKRLQCLEHGMETGLFRPKNILLLSGERPLHPGVDGPEYDDLIKKKGNCLVQNGLERDLLQHLYDSNAPAGRKCPVTMIHGEKGSLPRATTESTIKTLLNGLKKNPDIKTITFISSQPHVLYQKAIILSVLQSCNSPIHAQFVGAASGISVDEALSALGSYIWAVTPSILSRMSLPKLSTTGQKKCQAFFKESYGRQGSLYGILPKTITKS
jgi:hypothetical protein